MEVMASCPACGAPIADSVTGCAACAPSGGLHAARAVDAVQVAAGANQQHPASERSDEAEEIAQSEPVRTREEWVELCLPKVLALGDFPACSQSVQRIEGITGDQSSWLPDMTAALLRDYGLTLAVLRRASSAQHSRAGRVVATVGHAVTLLGLEGVKALARQSPVLGPQQVELLGLRTLMLLSLLTASRSRLVAEHLRLPRNEEAYLCGLFRNLGEVLVAACLPEEYAQVLQTMRDEDVSAHDACLITFHFTHDDLGRAVAREWKLPKEVVDTMIPFDPRAGRGANILFPIVAFSHELTESVYRYQAEEKVTSIKRAVNRHGALLQLDVDKGREILATAFGEHQATFTALGVSPEDLALHRFVATGEPVGERDGSDGSKERAAQPGGNFLPG